jgi:hypothetical protein
MTSPIQHPYPMLIAKTAYIRYVTDVPSPIMGFPTILKNVRYKRNRFSVFIPTVPCLQCFFSLTLSIDSCVTSIWILNWKFSELMKVPCLRFLQRVNDAQKCVGYWRFFGTNVFVWKCKLFDNEVLWNLQDVNYLTTKYCGTYKM